MCFFLNNCVSSKITCKRWRVCVCVKESCWYVNGEAYCQWCGTVRGSYVQVSLSQAMWWSWVDLWGVAKGNYLVSFTAWNWGYKPHAFILYNWVSVQTGKHQLYLYISLWLSIYLGFSSLMDLCFVCWENVGKDRKLVPGRYVVLWFLLFLGGLTWGKAWVNISVVVWRHRLIVGLSMFLFFIFVCYIWQLCMFI